MKSPLKVFTFQCKCKIWLVYSILQFAIRDTSALQTHNKNSLEPCSHKNESLKAIEEGT